MTFEAGVTVCVTDTRGLLSTSVDFFHVHSYTVVILCPSCRSSLDVANVVVRATHGEFHFV